ncbi:hypothetical protein ACWCQV_42055, partial [Streptomyces eurythermus]
MADLAPGGVVRQRDGRDGVQRRARAAWRSATARSAVMVPPTMVGKAGAVFLHSGSHSVFEQHSESLRSLGEPRCLGDDPGLAVLCDTALLDMMYAALNGCCAPPPRSAPRTCRRRSSRSWRSAGSCHDDPPAPAVRGPRHPPVNGLALLAAGAPLLF